MILNQRQDAADQAMQVARAMMTAARTAPKSRGNDNLEIALLDPEAIKAVSAEMTRQHELTGRPVFARDAVNILQAQAMVVMGYRAMEMGLNCGHCGFSTCESKPQGVPCVYNGIDLGIALGAACAAAADHRVDTRVMYSAGIAVQNLDILPGCKLIHAIPVSISSKNPFFDR